MYKCAQIASGQCALIEGDNDGCHLCVTLALCSLVMATSCQETVEDKFLIFEPLIRRNSKALMRWLLQTIQIIYTYTYMYMCTVLACCDFFCSWIDSVSLYSVDELSSM